MRGPFGQSPSQRAWDQFLQQQRDQYRRMGEGWLSGQETKKLSPLYTPSTPAPTPDALISGTWAEFHTQVDNRPGMTIHVAFIVTTRVRKGVVSAFFFFADGTPLKCVNPAFGLEGGMLCVGGSFERHLAAADLASVQNLTPFQRYDDYVLFMPYSELHLAPGKHDLQYQVLVADEGCKTLLAHSDVVSFHYQAGGA